MKRKRQATGTESLRFGQWPFADGVESADAADAARYRYLTRPGRARDFIIPAHESKASCDVAIDTRRRGPPGPSAASERKEKDVEKKKAQELAESAGLTWLTTKDYGDELLRFAELVAANEREECAALCEKHYREPMILRATTIDEDPFCGFALDCAELIRMRSNGEVRGASPIAGEASSAEGATSTVVLGAERPGKD